MGIPTPISLQIFRVDHLHHNTSSGTATITDRSTAVLALLELVQEGNDDPRTRAAERVAQSNSAAARVDLRGVEVKDLVIEC
jgi:hypothetical protein